MRDRDHDSDVDLDDALPRKAEVPPGGFRDRMRSKPGIGQVYRLLVFLLGLAFIALGAALVVLPGPLTIPPIILGFYIWSTEFAFADRLFDKFREEGKQAWEAAKRKPVQSAILTGGGLVAAGFAIWAVLHFELVGKAREAIGI